MSARNMGRPYAATKREGGIAALVAGVLVALVALQLSGAFDVVKFANEVARRAPAVSVAQLPAAQPTTIVAVKAPAISVTVPTSKPVAVQAAQPPAVSVAQPTAMPAAECILATWPDGSQSCNDGRPIDAAHSQPGYCKVTTWGDGSRSCDDGKPAGFIVEPSPPQPEPVWREPSADVQWAAADGPSGNTCVTVNFADGRSQSACSDPNVKLSPDTATYVAWMIETGQIKEGRGIPKG